MNQEIKAKWVEALRSGEYKQTIACLHGVDVGFCCLGVLCDLYVREGLGVWAGPGYVEPNGPINTNAGFLPVEVKNWAQLSSVNPIIPKGTYIDMSLATLNDLLERNFVQIADVIEETL